MTCDIPVYWLVHDGIVINGWFLEPNETGWHHPLYTTNNQCLGLRVLHGYLSILTCPEIQVVWHTEISEWKWHILSCKQWISPLTWIRNKIRTLLDTSWTTKRLSSNCLHLLISFISYISRKFFERRRWNNRRTGWKLNCFAHGLWTTKGLNATIHIMQCFLHLNHKHKSQVKHLNHKHKSQVKHLNDKHKSQVKHLNHKHKSQVKHINQVPTSTSHKSSIWIPTPLQRFTSPSHKSRTPIPLQRYPRGHHAGTRRTCTQRHASAHATPTLPTHPTKLPSIKISASLPPQRLHSGKLTHSRSLHHYPHSACIQAQNILNLRITIPTAPSFQGISKSLPHCRVSFKKSKMAEEDHAGTTQAMHASAGPTPTLPTHPEPY